MKPRYAGIVAVLFVFTLLNSSQVRADVVTGLTHLWNFESNLDDVVGGLDGSSVGSTAYAARKIGANAVSLGGGGAYVNIASQVIANQQNNYTWAAWMKKADTGNYYLLESKKRTSRSRGQPIAERYWPTSRDKTATGNGGAIRLEMNWPGIWLRLLTMAV